MKIGFHIAALLIVAGCHGALSQVHPNGNNIRSSSPNSLFAFAYKNDFQGIYIGWTPVDFAAPNVSYFLRIYRKRDGKLVREVPNIISTIFNETTLAPATNYSATVASVYFDGSTRHMSKFSEHVDFTTNFVCPRGKPYTQCTAHCVSTCANPIPVCSRICVPGCACPLSNPIWHNGRCIPGLLCPPPIATLVKPTKVNAFPSPDGVDLAWETVKNASYYVVKVILASTQEVEQTLEVTRPTVSLTNLTPGQLYIFSVRAAVHLSDNAVAQKYSLLPPKGITASSITTNSFQVWWGKVEKALSYSFVLYDENQTNVFYHNDRVAGNGINVEGLAPGTTYYFKMASVDSSKKTGIYSELQGVRTTGTPMNTEMFHAAVIPFSVDSPTTTTQPSATTTSAPMITCSQQYASVAKFYNTYPNKKDGPVYPNCDDQGRFVTRLCVPAGSGNCYCVHPDTGRKVEGSDFGGKNSFFNLNCNEFGSLNLTSPLELRVDQVHVNSLRLIWREVPAVNGYVIVMSNDPLNQITISVPAGTTVYTLENLLAGQVYTVGIYAVNSKGWTSPMTTIQTETSFVDKPSFIQVTDSTPNSFTVTWSSGPVDDSYNVRLISSDTKQLLRTYDDVYSNRLKIGGLTKSTKYIIEVRALYQENDDLAQVEPLTHMSDPAVVEASSKRCVLPPLDILYVFDISRPVTEDGLRQEQALAVNITKSLPKISLKTGTRVGSIKYYNIAKTMFSFLRFNRSAVIEKSLEWPKTYGPFSDTTAMLQRVKHFYNAPDNTLRPNTKRVTIIMSGGLNNNERFRFANVKKAAQETKRFNVITVGVRGLNFNNYLEVLASNKSLAVTVPSSLANINSDTYDHVMEKICSVCN